MEIVLLGTGSPIPDPNRAGPATLIKTGDSFEVGSMQVSVCATVHAPVEPTVGYRVEREGKVAALAGDTIPCAGLDELTDNADVYVQTVIRDDLVKLMPMERI